jgi:hypothetical protein
LLPRLATECRVVPVRRVTGTGKREHGNRKNVCKSTGCKSVPVVPVVPVAKWSGSVSVPAVAAARHVTRVRFPESHPRPVG